MLDVEKNGLEVEQNQATVIAEQGTPATEQAPKPVENLDTEVLSDAEVAEKSVEELDKLIQQASDPSARKDNANNAKTPEPKAAKPAVKVKTIEGEEKEVKALEEAQKYNGRLTNEVGNLRKENEDLKKLLEAHLAKRNEQTPEEIAELKRRREQELQDKVLVDPKGVIKEVLAETQAEEAEQEAQRQKVRFESVKYIKERHPEILDKDKGGEIAQNVLEYMATEGYSPSEIEYVKKDPFGKMPPQLLSLFVTIGKLQARIKHLEAATTGKSQDIVSKINAAASSPSIVAKGGQGVPSIKGEVLSDAMIASMSTEEIERKLKELSKG